MTKPKTVGPWSYALTKPRSWIVGLLEHSPCDPYHHELPYELPWDLSPAAYGIQNSRDLWMNQVLGEVLQVWRG